MAQVVVGNYGDVIRAHASRAVLLYKNRVGDLERLSGLTLAGDGSNSGASKQDVVRYLKAVEAVGGTVAAVSARLLMKKVAMDMGLDADF